MGIYCGPAPIRTDEVADMFFALPIAQRRVARWVIGRDMWLIVRNLRYGDGRYICDLIRSIGTVPPLTILGCPIVISDDDPSALRLEVPEAATGTTERLAAAPCRECGDVAPTGAAFCIACGAPRGDGNG